MMLSSFIFVKVTEETLSKIVLDKEEYDEEQGFMRYDGSQEVRPVIMEAYKTYLYSQK